MTTPRPLDEVFWDMWRDTWLRLAHGAALNGRVTVLCGSLLQSQLESVPARKLLGPIHFCQPRLPRRSPGGAAARPAVLAEQLPGEPPSPSTSVSRPGLAPTSSRPGTPASSPPAKPPTVSRPGCGTCLVKRLQGADGGDRPASPRAYPDGGAVPEARFQLAGAAMLGAQRPLRLLGPMLDNRTLNTLGDHEISMLDEHRERLRRPRQITQRKRTAATPEICGYVQFRIAGNCPLFFAAGIVSVQHIPSPAGNAAQYLLWRQT